MSKDNLPNIGTVAMAEIGGLAIRYARAGVSKGIPIILTAPWPESIYAFHRVAPKLGREHPVILVALPGFGLSQSRPDVMAPEAMGVYFIKILKQFNITRAHIVAPDVGTPVVLFASSNQENFFESMVIGGAA